MNTENMSQAHAPVYSLQARAVWRTAATLDPLALALARGMSRFTRITEAGVFYWPDQPSFWDAWKERQQDGSGSLTIRMGRLEVIVDWRGTGAH